MTRNTPISVLEEEARRAHHRLTLHRARLYRGDIASPVVIDRHLRDLERRWWMAAARLHKARSRCDG